MNHNTVTIEQLRAELAVSQAQVARLRDELQRVTGELAELIKDERDDRSVGIVGWDSMHESVADARKVLKETNPNATVPVTSRGRWDSKPHLCTVCGQNPVNPHDGIDTCDTCNP